MFKYAIALFMLCTSIQAQPRFTLQFTGGYSIPLADFRGKFGETIATLTTNNPDTATYYMQEGLNFGIYGKKAFGKSGNFRVTGGITYNRFSQSREYTEGGLTVNFKLNYSIVGLVAGAEWSFFPRKSKFNPFVEGALSVNFFSGGLTDVETGGTNEATLDPTARLGFQAGGGMDFPLSYNVGLVAGFKYSIANLVGKKSGTDLGSTFFLKDELYGKKRTIAYFQLYGGISFYFGY